MNSEQTFESQTADLFDAALTKPLSEREAFVLQQAGDNRSLANAVLNLLKAHESTDEKFVLDQPLGVQETGLHFAEVSEREGDTIGRYKLLERIGEGGMGVVYMAEQNSDIRRRVALKIIKLGMDTKQVVARFENERQAMAMFDHPGITRLLDAGVTETGRPFYVMELVKGRSVVEFADKHQLSVDQRLELLIDICHAFQHAHQKGIIHRDIKPSNILVGMIDGKPAPKIIDFGIAKALHHRLANNTVVTRHSALIGTPQYMSPEQAESSGVDVDTRSDIYGLGVLLYELITGTTPLLKNDLNELNPLALIETLRNHDVETPSTRISKLNADSIDAPEHREQFQGKLPTELDWIVMKSLAKNRSQRYQSANEMADDIRRFLDGDPIEAAPPSRAYRLKTHVRKHFKAYSVGALCFGVILLSSIASLIFGVKAHFADRDKTNAIAALKIETEKLQTANQLIEEKNLEIRYRKILDIATIEASSQQFAAASVDMVRQIAVIREQAASDVDQSDLPDDANELEMIDGPTMVSLNHELPELSAIVESLELKELIRPQLESLLQVSKAKNDLHGKASHEAAVTQLSAIFGSLEGAATLDGKPTGDVMDGKILVQTPDGGQLEVPFDGELNPAELMELSEKGDGGSVPFDLESTTKFLEILADGFRNEFGDSNPEIIKALNLYAAALIQGGKLDLARATLLQAKGIAPDEASKAVTEKLLNECR